MKRFPWVFHCRKFRPEKAYRLYNHKNYKVVILLTGKCPDQHCKHSPVFWVGVDVEGNVHLNPKTGSPYLASDAYTSELKALIKDGTAIPFQEEELAWRNMRPAIIGLGDYTMKVSRPPEAVIHYLRKINDAESGKTTGRPPGPLCQGRESHIPGRLGQAI